MGLARPNQSPDRPLVPLLTLARPAGVWPMEPAACGRARPLRQLAPACSRSTSAEHLQRPENGRLLVAVSQSGLSEISRDKLEKVAGAILQQQQSPRDGRYPADRPDRRPAGKTPAATAASLGSSHHRRCSGWQTGA